jgi:hypothetical protein
MRNSSPCLPRLTSSPSSGRPGRIFPPSSAENAPVASLLTKIGAIGCLAAIETSLFLVPKPRAKFSARSRGARWGVSAQSLRDSTGHAEIAHGAQSLRSYGRIDLPPRSDRPAPSSCKNFRARLREARWCRFSRHSGYDGSQAAILTAYRHLGGSMSPLGESTCPASPPCHPSGWCKQCAHRSGPDRCRKAPGWTSRSSTADRGRETDPRSTQRDSSSDFVGAPAPICARMPPRGARWRPRGDFVHKFVGCDMLARDPARFGRS